MSSPLTPMQFDFRTPVRHVDKIHSCKHCERITIKSQEMEHWDENGVMILLPHTRAEARLAAKDECPLFRHFARLFKPALSRREMWKTFKICFQGRQEYFDADHLRIPSPLDPGPYRNSKYDIRSRKKLLSYLFRHLLRQHLYLSFDRKELRIYWLLRTKQMKLSGGDPIMTPVVRYNVTAAQNDPAAEATTLRPFNPDVSSAKAFGLAKQWLTECLTSHTECSMNPAPPPSRLLKIGLLDNHAPLQLVDMQADQRTQWCNLSYVWGGVQTAMTTRKAMNRSIPIPSLPQTMQDAIFVARSLGITYIWIDSLCIVQDDPEDMQRQLLEMPRIYRDAVLTISASAARNVQEGFLHDRGYDYTMLEPFSLRYRSSDGSNGELLLLEIEEYIDWRADYPEPIDTRGWCFQEQVLSTRRLIYTRKQIKWACRTCERADGGVDPRTKFSRIAPELRSMQASRSSRSSPRSSSSSQDATAPLEELWYYWRRCLKEYSTRKLSKPADKLRAIAALARACNEGGGFEYKAGLWREHFPQALCWSTEFGETLKPTIYRAPSWSWAAVDGEIGYSGILSRFEAFESLIELDVTLPPDASFEAVSAGTLIIRGKMAPAWWWFNTGKVIVQDHEMVAFPDFREEQWGTGEHECLDVEALLLMKERNFLRDDRPNWYPLLPDGDWVGLLLMKTEDATYQRMAQFSAAGFQTPYMFSDREPQEVRIV